MTLRELDRLFLRASKDLDARQRARIKELKGLDRSLFNELVRRIVAGLDTEDGRVKSGKGSASINRMIDLAFATVERAGLSDFRKSAVGDLSAMIKHGQDYFGAMDDKPMREVNARVRRTMRRRLGFDPDTGKPVEGGQFDRLFDNEPIRTEVKQVVSRGITAKIPMAQMLKQLEVTVTGTKESPGVLSKALQHLVLDVYQQTDRAINKEYGNRLKLDTFIYAGGLIETSREFCKKRNNQVFTEEEAAKWKDDPTLPRSKKEKDSGVVSGYDPLVDMGRFNCRHRTRYISRELARELRPDLAGDTPAPIEPKVSTLTSGEQSLSNVEDRIRGQKFESASLYDAKGNHIVFKDGEARSVSFTAEEMRQVDGGVLTHNHPSGRSFSFEDFHESVRHGLREVRAAHSEGVYRMKLTNDVSYGEYVVPLGYENAPDKRGAYNHWVVLRSAYDDADKWVGAKLQDAIINGRMTEQQANATHHHEIWKRLSEQMGFTYISEKL